MILNYYFCLVLKLTLKDFVNFVTGTLLYNSFSTVNDSQVKKIKFVFIILLSLFIVHILDLSSKCNIETYIYAKKKE